MRNTLFFITFLIFSASCFSQEESWETYIAMFDNDLPGSIVVRMDLMDTAPLDKLDYVLVTGFKYETNRDDGLPDDAAFDYIYGTESKLEQFIITNFEATFVGSFTNNKERLHYYYLENRDGLENRLKSFYDNSFPDVNPYINLKQDPSWKYYSDFLYPSETIQNYLGDLRVVQALIESGDSLEKPRLVEHWAYFKDNSNRNAYKKKVEELGFKVVTMEVMDSGEFPLQIRISREDKVDLESINSITIQLRSLAAMHNGDYDGWETFVITD